MFLISWNKLINMVTSIFGAVTGPKYDRKYHTKLVKVLLGNTTINQTLTDVVIPTFDIKRLQPVIFSTDAVRIYEPTNQENSYIFLMFKIQM